jgi:hypothetical protein
LVAGQGEAKAKPDPLTKHLTPPTAREIAARTKYGA